MEKQLNDYGSIPAWWWKRLKYEIDEMVNSYPYGCMQDVCLYIQKELIPNIENGKETDIF